MSLRSRQIHLDFHTSERILKVGDAFDPDEFADTLAEAAVDSVTCFSRCHHGMIYHDTRFEARHPGLSRNLLPEMIEACHARDIRVPVYITVGFDEFQYQRHPEWQETGLDGKPLWAGPLQAGWHKICFSVEPYLAYVEEQTQEVFDRMPVDGIFFDIMLQNPCVCARCRAAMADAGRDPACEADRFAHAAEMLLRTKQRLHDAVRAKSAACPIFFNSGHVSPAFRGHLNLFSHLEIESLPSGGWGYDHFPTTVRYARNLGLDTLGMTGRFHKMWGDFGGYKNPAALEYECFSALAEGAKCSVGDQLHPSGRIDAATYALIGDVYRQVREREPWCAEAAPMTEIAVLTPEAVGANDATVDSALAGAYLMLAEGHHQFDVVDAESDWSRYSLLILPDKISVDEALAAKVNEFVSHGGHLILSYRSGLARDDGDEFLVKGMPCELLADARFAPDYLRPLAPLDKGVLPTPHVMYERGFEVAPTAGAEVLAEVWWPYFDRAWDHFCSHLHTPPEKKGEFAGALRKGRITYFAHPLFGMFKRHGNRICKQLVLNAVDDILNEPLVEAQAPATARISVMRQEKEHRTVVHLLHYVPENRYGNVPIIEDVIPLHEIALTVRIPKPSRVYLAPSGEELPFEYNRHRASITVPKVEGHQMVVFDDARE